MTSLPRYMCKATLLALCLAAANGAYAQIGSINSAIVNQRVFNDVPGATLTTVSSYPSTISFNEQNVSGSGFANRDTWQFSNNGGTSAYQFKNNDYFSATMTMTLTGSPITPRKEAGFLFSGASGFTGGDLQFFVDTDAHEVVQVGGISFFSFGPTMTYVSGTPITLGIDYFVAGDGNNAFQFFANDTASSVFEFAPGTGIDGGVLGGYFQIVQDSSNPENSGSAVFQNIGIVPEPSVFALLGLGLPLLFLRRRSK